jgi:hypothetical protein
VFKKWKQRKALAAAETQLRAWAAQDQFLEWCINQAQVVQQGGDPTPDDVCPIPLKADEQALFVLRNHVSLVELPRAPDQWTGRSSGVSIPVPDTKSMRYRVGGTRGTDVQGAESPTVIEGGRLRQSRSASHPARRAAVRWYVLVPPHTPTAARTERERFSQALGSDCAAGAVRHRLGE